MQTPQYAVKGKTTPAIDMTVLMQFAAEYSDRHYAYIGNGYIKYESIRAKELAKEIEYWGIVHGYNITASQVNNTVVVEVKESPFTAIIDGLDKLMKS